jgi:hypothetical protein
MVLGILPVIWYFIAILKHIMTIWYFVDILEYSSSFCLVNQTTLPQKKHFYNELRFRVGRYNNLIYGSRSQIII